MPNYDHKMHVFMVLITHQALWTFLYSFNETIHFLSLHLMKG